LADAHSFEACGWIHSFVAALCDWCLATPTSDGGGSKLGSGDSTMKLESLHTLYIQELRDLYHAEKQILKALPKMIEVASSQELRSALSKHLEETRNHVTRLERVFQTHNLEPKAETCKGMEGIIEEGKEIAGHDENPGVRDAGIIAGAQKVEHYEIASYGSVRTWAQQMGHRQAAELLQQTLDEEKQADAKLTQIAQSLNVEAVRHAG
jgi:ferritin-like metal-binding protein YciE